MLVPATPKFRRRRGQRKPTASTPPPAPLTLESASFDNVNAFVVLIFDRPIDISGLVANQIIVDDGDSGTRYGGQGTGTLIFAQAVQVDMTELESLPFPDTTLQAGPGTGIVAVDDGGTWPGATDLELPFP